MVSSISFKMRQIMFVLIMLLRFSTSNHVMNNAVPKIVLDECVQKQCDTITIDGICTNLATMGKDECIFDISKFSQDNVTRLFVNMVTLSVWLKCDGSTLSDIDLSKMTSIGIQIITPLNSKRTDYHETFTITNNLYLRRIILPHMKHLTPGFFTVRNNPRLSRLSIDNMRKHLLDQSVSSIDNGQTEATMKTLIADKAVIQDYGACDYYDDPTNPSSKKTSLSWLEFRWCRTINHDVILSGPEFKSVFDPAYILNVTGSLTIKKTKLTDLSILPVYFRSKGGEISGNEDLCISFEDEIRMKRLDFKMENNKDLSCRTTCNGGTLSFETLKNLKDCVTLNGGLILDGINGTTCNGGTLSFETLKNLKDCVTLNGGLILDGINATMAAADFFKTIRVINGPVVITNAKVTVDFKELKEITLAGEISPHISLTNCTHPILFPNLTTLNGTEGSPMVLLDSSRIDIFNYLNRTYLGKIKVLSRESMLSTITASGDIITSVSPSSNDKLTPGTVYGNRVVGQSTGAPGEQRDDREPDTIKPHGTPEEKPVEPITAVSPVGDTDQGAAKNSSVIQRDPNNSAVEGKSNVLLVMTIVSLVVFLASSATSVGIIIKYSVM